MSLKDSSTRELNEMGGSSSCEQALLRPFLSHPVFLCAPLTAKEKQGSEEFSLGSKFPPLPDGTLALLVASARWVSCRWGWGTAHAHGPP